jgi:hypothetical protein
MTAVRDSAWGAATNVAVDKGDRNVRLEMGRAIVELYRDEGITPAQALEEFDVSSVFEVRAALEHVARTGHEVDARTAAELIGGLD